MYQKEKSKGKNFAPDKLLETSRLLYPENEVFVWGETKKLVSRDEIYATMRLRFIPRIGATDDMLDMWHPPAILKIIWRSLNFGGILVALGLYLLIIIGLITVSWFRNHIDTIFVFYFVGLFIYLFIYSIWNIYHAKVGENQLDQRYKALLQNGKILQGEILSVDRGNNSFTFVTYGTDSSKRLTHFYQQKKSQLKMGDKIIVLYVDDELYAVL